MFPTPKVRLSGLQAGQLYQVGLEIRSVDSKRYRYVYHRWGEFVRPGLRCRLALNSHVVAAGYQT